MEIEIGGSVTDWIGHLKQGDHAAAQPLWERYFERLVGLARGFMYAGAARVVASLWKVDDAATAELMARFYRAMLTDRLSPPEALRAAQIQIRRQSRWQETYYWASFELQGEWK